MICEKLARRFGLSNNRFCFDLWLNYSMNVIFLEPRMGFYYINSMKLSILKSKLHRATITEANLDYVGSITIDEDLMDAAGLYEYEKVLVANLENGTRHETYVIKGARGSGVICSNGAAAHLVSVGDKVIILAFAQLHPDEIPGHKPRIVVVGPDNKVDKIKVSPD